MLLTSRRGNMAAAGDRRGGCLTSYQNILHPWECLGCDLFWQKYFQKEATLQLKPASVLLAWQWFLNLEWVSGSFYLRALFSMLLFSRSVMSTSLQPHGWQLSRLPCPSLSPRVCSNSYPLSRWCHPTISASVIPVSFCPQSFPASGSFPKSWLCTSGGPSLGASAPPSVLPGNIQGWCPYTSPAGPGKGSCSFCCGQHSPAPQERATCSELSHCCCP